MIVKFIQMINGKPGTVLASGATTDNNEVACFLMKMQDDGKSLNEAKAYAKIGPMMMPNLDWAEVDRVLATFIPGRVG